RDGDDALDVGDEVEDLLDFLGVLDEGDEAQDGALVAHVRARVGFDDVQPQTGEDLRDVAQEAGAVVAYNAEEDRTQWLIALAPARRHKAVGGVVAVAQDALEGCAVVAVDRDAASAGNEADDRIAGHRRAATGRLIHDVRQVFDEDLVLAFLG